LPLAQRGSLEDTDQARGDGGGKSVDFLYTITAPDPAAERLPAIINKLYIFVNNQFILNGIGIAKLSSASALLD
jgi:hypothetical protein